MAVQSPSVLDPDAQELNEKDVLTAGASGRRAAVAGTRSRRDDDKSVRDATRQLFVGLALAGGVVPAS
jgi:hypothetical protein